MNMNKPVLYVEDNEDDIFLLREAFQRAGIKGPLIVVNSVNDAKDYLLGNGNYADRVSHPIPFFVLVELNVSGGSGFDLLKWIRREVRTLPVIVFTSSDMPEDIVDAYSLGANAYVSKDETLEEWTESAKCMAQFWLDNNIPPPMCADPLTHFLHITHSSRQFIKTENIQSDYVEELAANAKGSR